MSSVHNGTESQRSKFVELFGTGKSKTLPYTSADRSKEESLPGGMKNERTRTVDVITSPPEPVATPVGSPKHQPSAARLSSLPKLSRKTSTSNCRPQQKKSDSSKERNSVSTGLLQGKSLQLKMNSPGNFPVPHEIDAVSGFPSTPEPPKQNNLRYDRKSSVESRRTPVKDGRRVPMQVTNQKLPHQPAGMPRQTEEDPLRRRKVLNPQPQPQQQQQQQPLPSVLLLDEFPSKESSDQVQVEVKPMSPIVRYNTQGNNFLSRISQRYLIDPSRATGLHQNSTSGEEGGGGGGGGGGMMELQLQAMNKSLHEGLRTVTEYPEGMSSSAESLISNNNKGDPPMTTFKPTSEGAIYSQRSSLCSLRGYANYQPTSGEATGPSVRVKSATTPTSSGAYGMMMTMMTEKDNSHQPGARSSKRYERSNSMPLAGTPGSVGSSHLPTLALTSIPERIRTRDLGTQHFLPSRPKALDLPGKREEFLQESRHVFKMAEVTASPLMLPRKLTQHPSPSADGENSCRWNATSSSSSSSLLSLPQSDPKRFHSSLPRSTKSCSGGIPTSHDVQQDPPANQTSRFPTSAPVLSPYDKCLKMFSLSASHIGSSNGIINLMSNDLTHIQEQRRVQRAQGSQSCSLTRKNTSILQQQQQHPQQQQQQQQHSPLKSLYSLDESGDLHESVLSLISNTSSSLFSTLTEERQAQEIKRLRHELEAAHEKINSLTNQLNTNVCVVGAFEHSLTTMTNRLQKLTKSSELKDVELAKLKSALEEVERAKGQMSKTFNNQSPSGFNRQPRHVVLEDDPTHCTPTNSTPGCQGQTSCESIERKRKKMLWTRLGHTFKKAFSKKREGSDSETDVSCSSEFVSSLPMKSPELPIRRHSNQHLVGYRSVPSTPLVSHRRALDFFESFPSRTDQKISQSQNDPLTLPGNAKDCSLSNVLESEGSSAEAEKVIASLRQQLHEKEMGLTDVRLEALSAAHMMEQLKETLNQLKLELCQERSENERLLKILKDRGIEVASKSSTQEIPSRQKSFNSNINVDQSKLFVSDSSCYNNLSMAEMKKNVPRYLVTVRTNSGSNKHDEIPVGSVSLTSKTKWETLDATVNRIFQEYLYKVDASNCLGLSTKSIQSYFVGEIRRTKGDQLPELLPCGYLVGNNNTIVISLADGRGHSSVNTTSFETLMSKKSLERYANLLLSYANLIVVGPILCGKTYLAHKIAHHVSGGCIEYINVDCVSKEEFEAFMSKMSSSSSSSSQSKTIIIIIDNLTHSIIISALFVDFVEFCLRKRKFLIGTMLTSQYRASQPMIAAKIQASVLDNQSEPLQGLLSRHLQRRVIEEEIRQGRKLDTNLVCYLKYLVQVHNHLCSFIRDRCNQTIDEIGPTIFFLAPLDKNQFQEWFTQIWNEKVIPYLTSAMSGHLKVVGNYFDPTLWVAENLPWDSSSLFTLTSPQPPDLLITSPRSRKVKRSKVKCQTSETDDDDDGDVNEERRDDLTRLIDSGAYLLPSTSSLSSPSSSSSSSSSPHKVSSSSSSTFKSKIAVSNIGLTSSPSLSPHQRHRHHLHHHFALSPQVMRKNEGSKKIADVDPLTSMLQRLQEAATTSTSCSTPVSAHEDECIYDTINDVINNNNNNNNTDDDNDDDTNAIDSNNTNNNNNDNDNENTNNNNIA